MLLFQAQAQNCYSLIEDYNNFYRVRMASAKSAAICA